MADLNLKLVISGSNDGAIAALNQVVERSRATGTAIGQADSAGTFSKTRQGIESISTQLARLQTGLAGFASGTFLLTMARDAVQAADEMKGIESRVRLASASFAEFNQNMVGIRATARASGTELASVAALFNRIAQPIRDMGGSATDAQAAVSMVGNALRVSGASAAESSSTMLQFAQAMGSGVLRGEELNSILENAPRLAQAIAAGLGVTIGELKTLGEQGALTSQQVFKALKSQQAALAEEASRLPQTVGMAWTNVSEGVKQYVSQIDKATGASGGLANMLGTVAANVPAIATALGDVAIVAAVAFGARQVSAVATYIAAQRLQISTAQGVTETLVREAAAELALRQALAAKAAEELGAIKVTTSYTLATNEAAAADLRRAAASRLSAANQGVTAAASALAVAQTAAAAASVGLLGRTMGIAAKAGRGLLALFGGPLGLAITAITAGVLAWDHFGSKSKKAAEEAAVPVKDLIKNFKDFSAKAGPNELEEQLVKLRGRAAELADELQNPAFRQSDLGKAATKDLKDLEAAIDEADKKAKKFNSERAQEKAQLGLDKLKLDTGGLVDVEMQKSLKAFSTLYADFVAKATNDNGQLKVTALEARAALEKLFSQAKTPAEFTSLVGRLGDAMKASPKDATLQSYLENAIEARSQAEMKALSSLVSGLEARAQRTQALFSRSASIALAQYNQSYALAKVAAELNNDAGNSSRLETNGRNAELAVAVQSANLQISALEQLATRKRQLAQDSAAAAKSTADTEIAAAQAAMDGRIAAFQKEVDEGKKTAGQLKDYRAQQDKDFLEKTAGPRAARVQAEADSARQIQRIDADTAQQRAAIAEELYKSLQSKANEALSQYKTYASQVIALDKSIQNNRLDTNAAIGALQRTGMDPKAQLQSLRDELAIVQAATAEAQAAGRQDQALELLNRQKSLASSIGQQSGDGIDKKKQIEEGSNELARIGAEADAILQQQRDAAAAAAQQQLDSYKQMTAAMNDLATQITALNEKAAIKLKPEIDKESLDGAIAAVKQAFSGMTVPVNVKPIGLPDAAAAVPADTPARAYGGELPGSAPHDRADNRLYWGTPGEWVIQRPAVRHYGAAWIAAVNAMRLPKYAFGGEIGSSSMKQLSIPKFGGVFGSQAGEKSMYGNFYLDRQRYEVQASRSTFDSLAEHFSREALKKGGRR